MESGGQEELLVEGGGQDELLGGWGAGNLGNGLAWPLELLHTRVNPNWQAGSQEGTESLAGSQEGTDSLAGSQEGIYSLAGSQEGTDSLAGGVRQRLTH